MEDVPSVKTLRDIAREAGVSLATVDRVLHDRPGVRPATSRRVKETIERHEFRSHAAAAELARSRQRRFAFVMPSGPNLFMQQILAQLSEMDGWLKARRIELRVVATDVFDPDCLAGTLESLSGAGDLDGIAVVALDHPRVRAAIDDLARGGTKVITLISDAPLSLRSLYVGIDNIAAGRTAGALVGRFIGEGKGKIAIIAYEARAAVRVLLALTRGELIFSEQERIRIDIMMRDNMP
jgi:LacI family transcriptional regulator